MEQQKTMKILYFLHHHPYMNFKKTLFVITVKLALPQTSYKVDVLFVNS